MREHGLIIIVWLAAIAVVPLTGRDGYTCLFLEHQLILRHPCVKNMVGHEHVQGIEAVGIVVAGADFLSRLADHVIPGSRTSILLIGISHQIVKTIDAILTHDIVRLRKDREPDLALRGTIERLTIGVLGVRSRQAVIAILSGGVLVVLTGLGDRIGKPGALECLIEDRIIFQTFKDVTQDTGRLGNDLIHFLHVPIGHLDILIGDDRSAIKDRVTLLVHRGRDRTAEHRRDGSAGATHLQDGIQSVGEMVTGDVVAQTVAQSFQRIGGHAIMGYRRLGVVVQTVDIFRHALVAGGIAGILSVRVHHAVQSHTLQDIIEGRQRAVSGDKLLHRLSCSRIEVRLVNGLRASSSQHRQPRQQGTHI